jgi:2-C-methyl-D-erythritol 4-phosphate cytidylyltransferase
MKTMTSSKLRTVGVAIPAAGLGARMGGQKKAFLPVGGIPLLQRTLQPFLAHPSVGSIVVAVPLDDVNALPEWAELQDPRVRVVAGGMTRLHSVRAALAQLPPEIDVVLVHDAARPLVTRAIIDRCIAGVEGGEGVVAGWPSVDSLKEVDDDLRVLSAPDRDRIWRAQTPQAFPRRALQDAYRLALEEGAEATDDATLFARSGGRVRMVEGGAWNLKITHPDDLVLAEFLLSRSAG